MKIDLDKIDQEQFRVLEHTYEFGKRSIDVVLVTPKSIKVKWTPANLKYRSSIWTADGRPVSLGFPKFFNWAEAPDIRPAPVGLESAHVVEKIDGSCLIVSPNPLDEKGSPIIRTRGTFDAYNMPNGHELNYLRTKYPAAFNNSALSMKRCSYLFEWVSPENQIIIGVDKPDIKMLAIINHEDYSLEPQFEVEHFATSVGIPRPANFQFDTPEQMIDAIAVLEDCEGACVYYNNDQWIRKMKSAWYLALHRMKSDLGTIERVIEVYFALDQPKYQDFMARISETFDYEVISMARGHISRVCDAAKEVDKIIAGMHRFIEKLHSSSAVKCRKDQAERIISSYGKTNRAGYVFSLLDGKELDKDALKKLIYQVLK